MVKIKARLKKTAGSVKLTKGRALARKKAKLPSTGLVEFYAELDSYRNYNGIRVPISIGKNGDFVIARGRRKGKIRLKNSAKKVDLKRAINSINVDFDGLVN